MELVKPAVYDKVEVLIFVAISGMLSSSSVTFPLQMILTDINFPHATNIQTNLGRINEKRKT